MCPIISPYDRKYLLFLYIFATLSVALVFGLICHEGSGDASKAKNCTGDACVKIDWDDKDSERKCVNKDVDEYGLDMMNMINKVIADKSDDWEYFAKPGTIKKAVEYAAKAVDATGLAIGLRGKDGVVLAVQKFIGSKLYEPTTNSRICSVDQHVGFASAGLYPDARSLASWCSSEAHDYYQENRTKVPVQHIADRVGMYVHAYTLYSAVRPFGCCVMLSSCDKVNGPQLLMIDPSGLCFGYHGCAMGKNKQAAKTEIEKHKLSEIELKDLAKLAVKVIYTVKEEKDKNFEIELSWVGTDTDGKHEMVPDELAEQIKADVVREIEEADSDVE